jgi:hypothetical protein
VLQAVVEGRLRVHGVTKHLWEHNGEKFLTSVLDELRRWYYVLVLFLPIRGAYRGRHGRWVWNAVDAKVPGAISLRGRAALDVDGEVVWSWRPDAGAKSAKTLSRLAGDRGKKARSLGRARRKPLKPSRRECRLSRLNLW